MILGWGIRAEREERHYGKAELRLICGRRQQQRVGDGGVCGPVSVGAILKH